MPAAPDWISGFALAAGADVLIHDAQYSAAEYVDHVGWGHSAMTHTLALATAAGVGRLVTFHHDPEHDDDTLDAPPRGRVRGRGLSVRDRAGHGGAGARGWRPAAAPTAGPAPRADQVA